MKKNQLTQESLLLLGLLMPVLMDAALVEHMIHNKQLRVTANLMEELG